jgi:hypothetical protein
MLVMAILTTLPYLAGVVSAPPGDLQRRDPIRRITTATWLKCTGRAGAKVPPLLPPTRTSRFFRRFMWRLAVVRWSGLSPDVVYQLARIVCTLLMVWALWAFMAHYLPDRAAWWALLLCLFGGGIGYLLFLFAPAMTANVSPIEFWLLDAYTFLAAFVSPHFAAGIALLAVACLSLDTWTSQAAPGVRPAGRRLLTLFLSLLAVALVQPFDLLLLDGVLIAAVARGVLRKQISPAKALAGLALIGISQAAIVGYDWIVLDQYPVWQSFAAQNVTLSPPPVYYLLGYAPILLPALGGIALALRRRNGRFFVPICWLLGVSILVYAPLATQRRFVLGMLAPMAVLAVYWLADVALPWLRERLPKRHRLVLILYGAVATLSTITLFAWLLISIRNPANPDLYTPDEIGGLALDRRSDAGGKRRAGGFHGWGQSCRAHRAANRARSLDRDRRLQPQKGRRAPFLFCRDRRCLAVGLSAFSACRLRLVRGRRTKTWELVAHDGGFPAPGF